VVGLREKLKIGLYFFDYEIISKQAQLPHAAGASEYMHAW